MKLGVCLFLFPCLCFAQDEKRDTVPAIFIVSDTSTRNGIYWIRGYEIIQKVNSEWICPALYYLDVNKKRLKGSIVVLHSDKVE